MIITITIIKTDVLDEVAVSASYTGAKAADGVSTYRRTFVGDEDRPMLERFWSEGCSGVTGALAPWLDSVERGDRLVVVLDMPSTYDPRLTESIESDLRSSVVNSVLGKWYQYCHQEDAERCLADAVSLLDSALRKLYHRRAPQRPTPTPKN